MFTRVAVALSLVASLVLSTFHNPTCALVTLCGLLVFPVCEVKDDIVANNHTAQSYTDLTLGNFVLLAWSALNVVDLFTEFSGTYHKLFSVTVQLLAVCHGVSAKALNTSPVVTATHQRVPPVDTVHKSHFITAPAVPEPHVVGNKLELAL